MIVMYREPGHAGSLTCPHERTNSKLAVTISKSATLLYDFDTRSMLSSSSLLRLVSTIEGW